MSPMIFHLWYSRLTDLFLLGCITSANISISIVICIQQRLSVLRGGDDSNSRLFAALMIYVASDRCVLCPDLSPNISPCLWGSTCDEWLSDLQRLFPVQLILRNSHLNVCTLYKCITTLQFDDVSIDVNLISCTKSDEIRVLTPGNPSSHTM